jgi:hypothetical protein
MADEKSSGQVSEGMKDRGPEASETVRNTRIETDKVPMAKSGGELNWGAFNHNGWTDCE